MRSYVASQILKESDYEDLSNSKGQDLDKLNDKGA